MGIKDTGKRETFKWMMCGPGWAVLCGFGYAVALAAVTSVCLGPMALLILGLLYLQWIGKVVVVLGLLPVQWLVIDHLFLVNPSACPETTNHHSLFDSLNNMDHWCLRCFVYKGLHIKRWPWLRPSLKPCPKCNGTHIQTMKTPDGEWRVFCLDCAIETGEVSTLGVVAKGKHEAMEAWNRQRV